MNYYLPYYPMEPLKKIYKVGLKSKNNQDGNGLDCSSISFCKINHIIEIALKLAANSCYDSNKRLVFNGSPLNGTDIAGLVAIAMSNAKNNNKQKGISEFVYVLKKIGIDSNWIENSNIRAMLSNCSKVTDIVAESNIKGPLVLTNTGPVIDIDVKNSDSDKIKEPFLHTTSAKIKTPKSTRKYAPYNLVKKNGIYWIIPK